MSSEDTYSDDDDELEAMQISKRADMIFVISFTPAICLTSKILPREHV